MVSFSGPFRAPKGSAIRELWPYLSLPDMISFAGGYPSPALFDAEGLHAAMEHAMRAPPAEWLQYANTQGELPLREALSGWMARRGIAASADRILVTTGSQQGFDLILRVMLDPGDTVVVERPTYTTALQALRHAGARVVTVGTDADGMDVDELATVLTPGIKAIYTLPTFGNPTGATLPLARRKRLLELAVRHDVLIIEDDAYGDVRFDGEEVPALAALARDAGAEDRLVHLSTLSKIVAPGLRVGWMVAPPEILQRCVIAKQTVDLSTSPWIQGAAAHYLKSGQLARHLPRIVAGYREQAHAMTQALRERLAGKFMFGAPQGGMFVWGFLPNGVDAAALLRHAIEEKVMYVPGAPFYAEAANPQSVRLCFSMSTPERIRTGVERLGRAFQRYDTISREEKP
jgi:DNA-binding transcriptional MocR family regulator